MGSFAKNATALTALLDAEFRSRPLAHWKEALDRERITYSVIQTPEAAADDPQLRPNDIVVPMEGVTGMEEVVSNPISVRGMRKVAAKRAPELGEHNDEVLAQLGFTAGEIDAFRVEATVSGATGLETAR
jgi:formyl-CoA transferase